MSLGQHTAVAAALLLLSLFGCSERSRNSNQLPQQGEAASSGAGGVGGRGVGNGGASGALSYGDSSVPCTPELNDEFSTPCLDAAVPTDGAAGIGDAEVPPDDQPDAGDEVPADAGGPIEQPADDCSVEPTSCAQAAIITEPADVECTMDGDAIRVRVRACETCNIAGRLLQFWVGTRFCGTCTDGVSKGAEGERWFEAGACMYLDLELDLSSWSNVDPCVDVYPRFDNSGDDLITEASYQVRSCRCDRSTHTCVTCTDGACEAR